MSKVLESLERLAMPDEVFLKECERLNINNHSDYEYLKKELKRLEAIDNANPSEALNKLKENAEMFDEIAQENSHSYKDDTVVEAFIYKSNNLTIEQALIKSQNLEKENELLKEIIKSFFDRGCPLHQYVDDKRGLTIEVDDECSIMQLGTFKGVNLDNKLKEVLEDE